MTINLPYDSSDVTSIKLFQKNANPDDNLIDMLIYKNKTLLHNIQVINYSGSDRYNLFKLTTSIAGGVGDNNLPIEKEGWYSWIMQYSSGSVIQIDTGQLFIGDYDDSETEKIFYEK